MNDWSTEKKKLCLIFLRININYYLNVILIQNIVQSVSLQRYLSKSLLFNITYMKKKISHIKKCGGCSIQRLIKSIVLFPQYNYKCTKHQVLFQILSSYSLHRLHLHFTPLLDFFITIILPSYFHTPPSGFLFCTFRWPPVQITFSSESKCIKPIPLLYSFRLSL